MPNYCSNCIIVSGGSLEDFKKTLDTENNEGEEVEFSFHQTVPEPAKEYGYWYDWRCDNWGTKWDVSDYSVNIENDKVIIHTQTAWSPPLKWAETTISKFEDLHIEIGYSELGCSYYGVWKDGENDSKDIGSDIIWVDNDDDSEEEDIDLDVDIREEGCVIKGEYKKHIEKYEIGLGG